jgi:hypothetical protein
MIAGIDPFNADDPMVMYTNILESKLKFPVNFDRDAKSLVDHLLQQDVNKRYGNLKRGIVFNCLNKRRNQGCDESPLV